MKNFTMMPNGLFRYTSAEVINPTHIMVYLLMVRFFNEESGYAFPTVPEVAFHTGISERTATAAIQKLVEVGLLEKGKSPKNGARNHVYVPVDPIDNDEEFFERFAAARETLERRRSTVSERNSRPSASQRNKPIEEAESPNEMLDHELANWL